MAIINETDLNFQNALSVIPAAQSFVLPIPSLNSGTGVFVSKGGKSSEKDLVFLNSKDKTWQTVQSDGEGVVVINDVSPVQGKALLKKVMQLSNNQPDKLDKDKIKLFLKYTHALGLTDVSQSNKKDVANNMNLIEVWDTGFEQLGFHKYKNKSSAQAIRFLGSVCFSDPKLSKQTYENGCVVVKDEGKISVVKPDVFLKSYTKPNGSPITLFDIPMKLTTVQYMGMMQNKENAG
ncbi:MAG: hypothetical protein J6V53_06160 [Alphaproteobacteria bacterium]|nr:hypothetical protein [Alphaproteobacteria bacterium]